jgi:hypothetical protein
VECPQRVESGHCGQTGVTSFQLITFLKAAQHSAQTHSEGTKNLRSAFLLLETARG